MPRAGPDSPGAALLQRAGLPSALLLGALLPLVFNSPSHQNFLILVVLLAQSGVAWNIVGGYAGQVSLGHAAFFGIGAYTSTLLFIKLGINPWLGMVAGAALAALVSLPIGWACFRLKGHYFAMATIAVAEIVQIIFTNWDYAGAAVGLTLPMDRDGWSELVFNTKLPYYYLAFALLLLSLAVGYAIEHSYLGYYFRAIKDEPDAAQSLGVNLSRYKQLALALSSALTALGGSLYAQKELYIDPGSTLSTGLSIKMALAAILGGVGNLFGPVVGALVLTGVEQVSRVTFGGSGHGTDLIIYAVLIIAIAVYYPSGLLGWLADWRARHARARPPLA